MKKNKSKLKVFMIMALIVILSFILQAEPLFKFFTLFLLISTLLASGALYHVFSQTLKFLQTNMTETNIADKIIITSNTTPEEIEKMKIDNPNFTYLIDELYNNFPKMGNSIPQKIEDLFPDQLEKEKNKAIENNDFEKAAEIRDELLKRKLKS